MNFCPNCGHDLTRYGESTKVDPFDNVSLDDLKDKLKDKLDKADDTVKMIKDISSLVVETINKKK